MDSAYQRLCEFENLHEAYRAARQGKRGLVNAAAFERDLETWNGRICHTRQSYAVVMTAMRCNHAVPT
jgi:hypothetical protein